jgi:nucleotide-binding universal stress UspA family protein
MDWKDILVFADGSTEGLTRARLAAGLAIDENAHFRICAMAGIPAFVGDSGFLSAIDMEAYMSRMARDDASMTADAILSALPSLAGRVAVEASETELENVKGLAASLARLADVAIVSQPSVTDSFRLDDAILRGVLFGSGRPCLMFPRWTKPRPWGKRVLVAWKDTPEAARALHDALPILKRAQAVRIFGCGGEKNAVSALDLISAHLARHGVPVEGPSLLEDTTDVGAAILNEAGLFGADLIVMGAYGHSRLREMIFGGATETIVRHAKLPVFFAH